eukprot:5113651-Amphidinium_carterae.1
MASFHWLKVGNSLRSTSCARCAFKHRRRGKSTLLIGQVNSVGCRRNEEEKGVSKDKGNWTLLQALDVYSSGGGSLCSSA